MMSKAVENELLKNFSLLSKEQQDKVFAYIKSLLDKSRKTNQNSLLQFAGIMEPEDAQEISMAIEAGCENDDRNEW